MSDVSKAVRGLFGIDQYLEKRGENATIPDVYYAGRVAGSVVQTAAGILTTIKGAIEIGVGGAATLAGLLVGGSTSPITVGITAAGAAELALGASLTNGGLSNARKAVDEGKRKRRELEEARREAAEEQKKQTENENKLKKEADSAKAAGNADECPNANNKSKVSKPDTKVLRNNMIKAGIKEPTYKNAAHYIVAGSSPKAVQARRILESFGIDINSAENGVFLPTQKGIPGNAQYHPSLHTDKYYAKVNSLLSRAKSKEEAIDILDMIRKQLMKGTF